MGSELLSVLICSHNPRADYLEKVLRALRAQSLSGSDWELIVIDSASDQRLAARIDISWHPNGRHARVEEAGKVKALERGITEARGDLLVIVDDDNVLEKNYLEEASRISKQWPMLGAWSGTLKAEFEEAPEPWAAPYLCYLAIRELNRDTWSNISDPDAFGRLPWGAGMCVRRTVACRWAEQTTKHPLLFRLDRKGNGLLNNGEDAAMALTACDLGLGTGLFKTLRLTHLIKSERVREPYLLRLLEGMNYSHALLAAIRGAPVRPESRPRLLWGHVCALRRGLRELRFYRASLRGARAAARDFASIHEN